MIPGQIYKANKILLTEAFAIYDRLQETDVVTRETLLIRIKELIKEMSGSVKNEYGCFSTELLQVCR